MSPLSYSNNLAARMGRWSASHRKTAIFGWLAFVLAVVVLGTGAGLKQIDQSNSNVGQAHKADQILKQAGFKQADPLTEIVVIQSKQQTITDPAFRATVSDVVRTGGHQTSTGCARRSSAQTATRSRVTAARRWSSGR